MRTLLAEEDRARLAGITWQERDRRAGEPPGQLVLGFLFRVLGFSLGFSV